MTDPQQIITIFTSEDQSFSHLAREAGLDLSVDLVGCDFSHVDFGSMTVDVLNLRNCILHFANLSKVRGKIIIENAAIEGAILPVKGPTSDQIKEIRRRIDTLKEAALYIRRYSLHNVVARVIFNALVMRSVIISPIETNELGIFEFDSIVASLYDEAYETSLRRTSDERFGELVTISKRNINTPKYKIAYADPDLRFVDEVCCADMATRPISREIKPYSSVASIKLFGEEGAQTRTEVTASQLLDALRRRFSSVDHNIILIFVDINPPSSYLYGIMSEMTPNVRYAFLVRKNLQYPGRNNGVVLSLSELIEKFELAMPDVRLFVSQLEDSFPGLILTEATKKNVYKMVDKPLSKTKSFLLSQIFDAAKRTPTNSTIEV